MHDLPTTNVDILMRCAYFLKTLSQPLAAAQVYEKLDDKVSLVSLYVECKLWDMVSLYRASNHCVEWCPPVSRSDLIANNKKCLA